MPTKTNAEAAANADVAANVRRESDHFAYAGLSLGRIRLGSTAPSATAAAMPRRTRTLTVSRRGWDFMRGFLLAELSAGGLPAQDCAWWRPVAGSLDIQCARESWRSFSTGSVASNRPWHAVTAEAKIGQPA